MCFYHDYDWCASISEVTEKPDEKEAVCCECGKRILSGEWRRHIYQQEHEECRVCEWEEAEAPCEEHDYGISYEYDACLGCTQILAAVESVEEDEGCPPHAQLPALGELGEALDYDDEKKYITRAISLHPELASHKLIAAAEEEDA